MKGAKQDFDPVDRRLAFAMLAPPVIWLLHLSISFSLVRAACVSGSKSMLHLLTAGAFILIAGAGWLAFVFLRRIGQGPVDRGDVLRTRRRFMALSGVVFAVLFTILLVATEIPNLVMSSCS